jgi:hypothetical protein
VTILLQHGIRITVSITNTKKIIATLKNGKEIY